MQNKSSDKLKEIELRVKEANELIKKMNKEGILQLNKIKNDLSNNNKTLIQT